MLSSNLSGLSIWVDPSQFPDVQAKAFGDCLRDRQIDPKYHYLSYRQAQRWWRLHQRYSPMVQHEGGEGLYKRVFGYVAEQLITGDAIEVVSLGCGGGNKDIKLVELLVGGEREVSYLPMDVSLPLVLRASQKIAPIKECKLLSGTVGDVMDCKNESLVKSNIGQRIFLFLGMVPNMSPGLVLSRLASLLQKDDILLVSTNLFSDQQEELQLLAQYDNPETRHWLACLWEDLDVCSKHWDWDYKICDVSESGVPYKRIVADTVFRKPTEITYEGELFGFEADEPVRTFYSNRFEAGALSALLEKKGFVLLHKEVLSKEREGVWVLRAKS